MAEIKFGTSGWRAKIADEFTFRNVQILTQAISDYLWGRVHILHRKNEPVPKIVVGYDTRFLSEKFALSSAEVLSGNNIEVLLTNRDTPTPVISFEIIRQKLCGGINITASHNPKDYNGLKFSPSWGGPATPETTSSIEKLIKKNEEAEIRTNTTLVKYFDPSKFYIKRIKELIDLKAIKKSKIKIVIDLLYGTGRGYLDNVLEETGKVVKILHNYRDVNFGRITPEPSNSNLEELRKELKKNKADLGLSLDGDADRFGIVDADGTFITPNQIIAILLNHLVKTRGITGCVVRTVSTTHFIDAIAKKLNVDVRETPVGFKYIGEIMTKEDIIIGGEESGGLTIYKHIPEKDGILACLLVAELVAIEKKTIKDYLKELTKKVGLYLSERIDITLEQDKKKKLQMVLEINPPDEISGIKVKSIDKKDGFKFNLNDGSWLLIRFSGTEPKVRCYIETNNKEKLTSLTESGRKIILGIS